MSPAWPFWLMCKHQINVIFDVFSLLEVLSIFTTEPKQFRFRCMQSRHGHMTREIWCLFHKYLLLLVLLEWKVLTLFNKGYWCLVSGARIWNIILYYSYLNYLANFLNVRRIFCKLHVDFRDLSVDVCDSNFTTTRKFSATFSFTNITTHFSILMSESSEFII